MDAALQAQIAAAVGESWPAFSREHPNLARAIDQAALGRHVARSLEDDPAFIASYQAAIEANVGARSLANLVEQFVLPVLRRLL